MELTMNAPNTEDAEQLLAQAGLDFTVVERCPVADCEVCDTGHTLAAA